MTSIERGRKREKEKEKGYEEDRRRGERTRERKGRRDKIMERVKVETQMERKNEGGTWKKREK